ncbi:MAG TPA: glycosyl hydrolase [Gemmatirosa sp.]
MKPRPRGVRRAGVLLAGVLLAAACAGRARPVASVAPNTTLLAGGLAGGAPSIGAPVDPRATPETRALFVNLRRLAGHGVMFGHQESLAYGFTWVAEPGRSDVHDVTGSYPAVYGWDVSTLFAHGPRDPGGTARVDRMRGWIAEGYGRGGVITMSWHLGNPVTGRDAWDTTAAVAQLLPGGASHDVYRAKLDSVAAFFRTLRARGRDGREALVPVVFRPFHEMSGGWFWWGRRHATRDEYVALWRYTVGYLRDSADVHNLLYAYSPDVFASQADYLDRYPGDGYVDVLGFDDYQSVRSPALRDTLVRRLHDVVTLADARGKVAALTETGVEAIPDSLWWTHTLLPALTADSLTRRVTWALVWRNANNERDRHNHFFAAYRGQASAPDFVRFHNDPFVLFEDELPDLYHVADR